MIEMRKEVALPLLQIVAGFQKSRKQKNNRQVWVQRRGWTMLWSGGQSRAQSNCAFAKLWVDFPFIIICQFLFCITFYPKFKIITSLHFCIISSNMIAYNFNLFCSMFGSTLQLHDSLVTPAKNHKKKYIKVNETIKKEFLSLIIQNNMSIKQASHALNINYSSAKAILASHRKHLHASKTMSKNGNQAAYRLLAPLDRFVTSFSVICSTGGCQTSYYEQFEKNKPIFMSTIAPVILLKSQKEGQCSQNTENQVSQ